MAASSRRLGGRLLRQQTWTRLRDPEFTKFQSLTGSTIPRLKFHEDVNFSRFTAGMGRRLATTFNMLKQNGAPRHNNATATSKPGSSWPVGLQPGQSAGRILNWLRASSRLIEA